MALATAKLTAKDLLPSGGGFWNVGVGVLFEEMDRSAALRVRGVAASANSPDSWQMAEWTPSAKAG